jgi:hypothetical protein
MEADPIKMIGVAKVYSILDTRGRNHRAEKQTGLAEGAGGFILPRTTDPPFSCHPCRAYSVSSNQDRLKSPIPLRRFGLLGR